VEVKCVPGYDGGLPQRFVLEVYHGDVDFLTSSQPLYNVSNTDEPTFALAGLEASVEAGVHVAVYAVNAKGRSQPVTLSEVTYRDAEKRTGEYDIDLYSWICDAAFISSRTMGFYETNLLRLFFAVVLQHRRFVDSRTSWIVSEERIERYHSLDSNKEHS